MQISDHNARFGMNRRGFLRTAVLALTPGGRMAIGATTTAVGRGQLGRALKTGENTATGLKTAAVGMTVAASGMVSVLKKTKTFDPLKPLTRYTNHL